MNEFVAYPSLFCLIRVVDPGSVFRYNIKIKILSMKSLKQLVVIAVAFLVFLGTLGLESVFAGPVEAKMIGRLTVVVPSGESVDLTRDNATQTLSGEAVQDLQQGDTLAVKSGSDVEVHFSDRGVLRLSSNAQLGVDFLDSKQDEYVLNLKQGRVWENNLYTSAVFNLVANGAYVIPDYASVDVNIDGQKTLVYADRHQASIGLVPLDFHATSAKLFPDGDLINSYLLPEGNQTTVYADKITQNADTLKILFYSKLVKEFPFGAIDPQMLTSDAWIANNIKLDKTYENKIKDQTSQEIRSRGLKISDLNSFGYGFGQSLDRFYNFLTFSHSKVIARTNSDIFDHLDDAEYLLLFGQTTRANERLDYFKKALDAALASQDGDYKNSVLAKLRSGYDQLSYVSPDDYLAPAKAMVTNYLLAQIGDSDNEIRQKFMLVRNTMNSVYDLADTSSQSARQALEDYFTEFTQLVNKEQTRLSGMRNIIAEENQVMNNLLLHYPIFYRDRYFAIKYQLEQQWLALLPEGTDKNEEKQTIISQKIDFLRQLQTFFLADKIAADDAKQIVFRLFREADDLKLPPEDQVAVSDLYAKRLQDFGVFYRYLNSPEYVATTLHGSSRKTQFDQFVQAQQEQVSIEEIRQEILGNQTAPVITPDQILAQAQQDFASIGATNVVFGGLSDVTQKVVSLNNALVGGINISAQYDWDKKLVSQIYSGDTLISADAVNLSNLAALIKAKTQQPTPKPAPTPQPSPTPAPATSESKTELVAKILIIQKLKANNIGVAQGDLVIDDLSNSLFTIQKAILVSDQSVSFSFDVDGKNGLATNIVVSTQSGPQPIDGTLNLADVSAQVKSVFDANKAKP